MDSKIFLQKIALSEDYINKIARNKNKLYKLFRIPKRNGTYRIINAPNKVLKGIQRWILENILSDFPIHDSAMAYIKNKSIKNNAELHLGKKYIISCDLEEFYTNIKKIDIIKYFNKYYDIKLVYWISEICTFSDYLPQGAVTSPTLSNILFYDVDDKIAQYCANHGIVYTRYSDDISISSNNYDKLYDCYLYIKKLITEKHHKINTEKTKIMSGKYARHVTGINICYNENKITIKKQLKNQIRSEIYHYIIKGENEKENRILGLLCYVRYIDPKRYDYYCEYIKKLIEKKDSNIRIEPSA